MKERQGRILIIDDNREFLVALKMLLSPYFEHVVTESVPDRILYHLNQEKYDIVILDMNFRSGIHTGNEGFYWMNKIHEIDQETSVMFITAYGDVDLAIKSLKEGAVDFIQKSWDEHKMLSAILASYKLNQSKKEVRKLQIQKEHLHTSLLKDIPALIRGSSGKMEKIYEFIDKVANTDANVLITGESGTGKEVIAYEIHRKSSADQELFVAVDLGSVHENLFESELFGHAKGAFTDALFDRPGRFEIASGGTLFLDEIGNLPLGLQKKLLSVLQSKTVTRLGENLARNVDFRLISATNRSLDKMVIDQEFREDLLYRLKTVELVLPPLRERMEDIPVLAGYFVEKYTAKYDKGTMKISEASMKELMKHDWPGNIRELQNVIEKAVILADGDQLIVKGMIPDRSPAQQRAAAESFNLEMNEKEVIRKALQAFNWNMTKTARELGINRSTLYEKLKKYEL